MTIFTQSEARAFYDRFGEKQDAQAFYEDRALEDLTAHAAFEQSERVFEFGCGTGRFALRLLTKHLPPSATYFGVDISRTMIDIARQRLTPYEKRARLAHSDGAICFPIPDHSVDRVIATYVLDLLPENDIGTAISESLRVLVPDGKLCLVSLTHGVTFPSRIVCAMWRAAFLVHPPLVGGCRPVRLSSFFEQDAWSLNYRHLVTQFAVPSEVLIATPRA